MGPFFMENEVGSIGAMIFCFSFSKVKHFCGKQILTQEVDNREETHFTAETALAHQIEETENHRKWALQLPFSAENEVTVGIEC